MAIERMPITPGVLVWARERAGYKEPSSLASKRNEFKRVADWESGAHKPTYRQLEFLAKDLQVPVAVFFFPEPPDLPPLESSFRTLDNRWFAEIPPTVRLLLLRARAFQLSLYNLNDGKNPSSRLITRQFAIAETASDDDIAMEIRQFLGVTLAQQQSWREALKALNMWRQAFFDVGIYIFRGPFSTSSYSGFCLYDDEFPIIFVNSSNSKFRQIFTLFHELAHLLFHTSGIDKLDKSYVNHLPLAKSRVEVRCNRLAGYSLVPNDVFDAEIQNRIPSENTARELSRLFCVSVEVIYRKLLDRELISSHQYEQAKPIWDENAVRKGGGGDYYRNQISYLGENYISLAFRRYYEQTIDEEELADHLDTPPKNLEKLEHYMLQRGS